MKKNRRENSPKPRISRALVSKEVTKIGDGKFTVKWEDPDGGPEESEVDPKAPNRQSKLAMTNIAMV